MAKIAGEYMDPRNDDGYAVAVGRLIFLDRVRKVEPRVLGTLLEKVWPLYREAWSTAEEEVFPRREWWEATPAFWRRDLHAFAEQDPEAGYTDLLPLHDALRRWSARWHLRDEWLLDTALWTLREWTRHPMLTKAGRASFQASLGGGPVPDTPSPPTVTLPPREPLFETREAYHRRARQEFEQALAEYDRTIQGWAEESGLEPGPAKRARTGGDPGIHFEWCARFQVQEWTHKKIAREYPTVRGNVRQPKAVGSAIKETCELIGLTRRTL